MVNLSLPYIQLDTNVAFLRIKQWVFRRYDGSISTIWIIAFYIHVATSIFAVLAGFTQFFKIFLYKKTHRLMGKLYVFSVLIFTATSGLIMSFFANGGWTSIIAFTTLSLLWWFSTFKAFKHALNKQFDQHGKWMIRSYALTLSAITLRLWKYAYANYIDPDMDFLHPMDLYRIVAWLGWVPNLLFAEFLIRRKVHLKMLKR